jgi:hypothetical protein
VHLIEPEGAPGLGNELVEEHHAVGFTFKYSDSQEYQFFKLAQVGSFHARVLYLFLLIKWRAKRV